MLPAGLITTQRPCFFHTHRCSRVDIAESRRACVQTKHVKGSRMDFASFQVALQHIAELLGVPEADVQRAVATSRGPLVNAVTLPRFVRLHDAAPGANL